MEKYCADTLLVDVNSKLLEEVNTNDYTVYKRRCFHTNCAQIVSTVQLEKLVKELKHIRQENLRLKKELSQTQEDRDILIKAATYLAKSYR
ncbi:hypothetical protein [Agarilytica rhodophyticola]|uniref:hypothetical protein n=1 Tax=Agarilytica rhodophyticola TaxID=1737490 RepID=UPI000B347F3D|nr:hypothetical protein [Agarilytica rhodophyticola]